jgi:hypothetical protein
MVLQTILGSLKFWGVVAVPGSLAYHLVGPEAGLATVFVVGALALAIGDELESRLVSSLGQLGVLLGSLWFRQ